MIIVLDTNVLVSGIINIYGPPGKIVKMATSGSLQLCYDARIMDEYQKVLLRPQFPFHPVSVYMLLDQIKANGIITAAQPLAKRLPDPDDEPFLEVALAGPADYLVTGNIKHFPPSKRQDIRVIKPKEFIDVFIAGRNIN